MRASSLLLAAGLVSLEACGSASPPPASAAASAATPVADETPAEPSIVVTEAMGGLHAGDPAPDFELPDQNGQRVKLSDAKGQIVVLAFVASFCPFSGAEQRHLLELASDYKAKGVRVIAVGIDASESGYHDYLARMPMDIPVLRDEDSATALRYTPPLAQPAFKDRKMALVTSNLVLDPSGKIRFFTVLDTVHFDARLVHVRRAVDRLLREQGS
jgi:peroxiredoxin